MSTLSPALRTRGRATYRYLLRSAAVAFEGDARVLNGFRQKARNDFTAGRSITNEDEYVAQLSHAHEVALFLRKNLVQGYNDDGSDRWKLRWRDGIELGDNDTIKEALRKKKRPQNSSISPSNNTIPSSDSIPPSPTESTHSLNKPLKYLSKKALIEARNDRSVPEIREEDLEETFVRGGGPGGQAINKTRSNVSLLHKPTGIRVTCQETRSLDQNRKLARRLLLERLDQVQNPGLSKLDVKTLLERRRKQNRQRKAKKKKKSLEDDEDGVEGSSEP